MNPLRPARRWLPALLLVSGFCGISYEILYAKLLGNLLGDQFTIAAAVLLTFLFGIGVGTRWAHLFVRWLWLIEAGIGLYAVLMVAGYGTLSRLLYTWVPALGTSVWSCAGVSVVLLVGPALLVGCSVPLFAAYLGQLRSEGAFARTYGIYNLGAALTALGLEFLVLRQVGLRAATLMLGGLNGLVALGLLGAGRGMTWPAQAAERRRIGGRELWGLVLVSVASAIFQLALIKLAEFVFGPFRETFALVLAVVFLGLALGSWAVGRWGLTFSGAVLLGLGGVALLLATYPWAVGVYAGWYPWAVQSYPWLVLLKLGLVTVLMLVPAAGFGATIPALVRGSRDVARESGELLFWSSMGNVVGFGLTAFVLHRTFDYGPLLVIVAGLAGAGLVIGAGLRSAATWTGACGVLLALAAQLGLWDESLPYYGHTNFQSAERLSSIKRSLFLADRFRGAGDVFAITWRDGEPSFFNNGHLSIPLTAATEKIAGALSVAAAPRLDDALVLGIGSGATAGTVGLMFARTDAVEISGAILEHLDRLKPYNFDLQRLPGMRIVHDDGVHFLKSTSKRYSLIVNTVESPLYFSSSKLYTRDFLADVVARLTPDGVYTTWIDQDVGDRGIDVILETLSGAFDRCWLGYLKSSYYLLICSNTEIRAAQATAVAASDPFGRYLVRNHDLLARMIPYSVLSTDALGLRATGSVATNTLDFPVLEHVMSRVDRGKILEFNARLARHLDLSHVRDELGAVMPWDAAEFAVWGDVRLARGTTLDLILREAVPRQMGPIDERYAAAALAVAAEIGTAEAYDVYGRRLEQRGLLPAARDASARAAALRRGVTD